MRGGAALDDAIVRAAEIVADVRERGDAAVLDWTERFDGVRPAELRVGAGEIAGARVDDALLDAVRRLAAAVAAFHEPQRPPDTAVSAFPGIDAERRWQPLTSVGIAYRTVEVIATRRVT